LLLGHLISRLWSGERGFVHDISPGIAIGQFGEPSIGFRQNLQFSADGWIWRVGPNPRNVETDLSFPLSSEEGLEVAALATVLGEVVAMAITVAAVALDAVVAAVVLDAVVVAKIFLAFCVLWIWA